MVDNVEGGGIGDVGDEANCVQTKLDADGRVESGVDFDQIDEAAYAADAAEDQ